MKFWDAVASAGPRCKQCAPRSRQTATSKPHHSTFTGRTLFLTSNQQCQRDGDETYVHPFNGPLSGTTQVSQYQKGKTNLDFTEAKDSECSGISWAICKSAPSSRETTTPAPHHKVLQAGCPSCCPKKVFTDFQLQILQAS